MSTAVEHTWKTDRRCFCVCLLTYEEALNIMIFK